MCVRPWPQILVYSEDKNLISSGWTVEFLCLGDNRATSTVRFEGKKVMQQELDINGFRGEFCFTNEEMKRV
ncbi:hypothetical protein PAL_GLEAN10021625 [Pteropus alecto]|uniref:Uncharacterized protein n=1 Tax=Pteropus alecto TaxID=9402 RepID=L5KE73_PTEAL|nr:hypothetical protein PAL_GLEAN10021625 [Pteropus alecto]